MFNIETIESSEDIKEKITREVELSEINMDTLDIGNEVLNMPLTKRSNGGSSVETDNLVYCNLHDIPVSVSFQKNEDTIESIIIEQKKSLKDFYEKLNMQKQKRKEIFCKVIQNIKI